MVVEQLFAVAHMVWSGNDTRKLNIFDILPILHIVLSKPEYTCSFFGVVGDGIVRWVVQARVLRFIVCDSGNMV